MQEKVKQRINPCFRLFLRGKTKFEKKKKTYAYHGKVTVKSNQTHSPSHPYVRGIQVIRAVLVFPYHPLLQMVLGLQPYQFHPTSEKRNCVFVFQHVKITNYYHVYKCNRKTSLHTVKVSIGRGCKCTSNTSGPGKNRQNGKLLAGKFCDLEGKIKKYIRETLPHWREIYPVGGEFCTACRGKTQV